MTVSDITDRKAHGEQALLVMREIAHRSKNLIAVVSSVVAQTAREFVFAVLGGIEWASGASRLKN